MLIYPLSWLVELLEPKGQCRIGDLTGCAFELAFGWQGSCSSGCLVRGGQSPWRSLSLPWTCCLAVEVADLLASVMVI